MCDELNAAVIGLGMMGERHARIWHELLQTELVGVYDIVAERTNHVADALRCEAAGSLEELLALPGLDLVSICTDDQRHVAPCVAAAEAGKHILLEKPLATTVADADTIIDACRNNGVTLMVGHVVRFDPRYQVAKQAIDAGEVGDIVQVFGRRNNVVSSGRRIGPRTSVAFFLGSHDLDLMRWFCGSEVVRVYAESASKVLADIGCEDTIFALLKYANGAVGCLETCWVVPEGVPNTLDARLEVVGSLGRVAVRVGDESLEIAGQERARRPDIAYGPIMNGLQHGALRTQLEHFAHCVHNKREPMITPADARAAVEVCQAIHESLRTHQPVNLSPA
jgi:UDP-N-acetylglucosamine 3-dehydrogenase